MPPHVWCVLTKGECDLEVVYLMSCMRRSEEYIGETERPLCVRVKTAKIDSYGRARGPAPWRRVHSGN